MVTWKLKDPLHVDFARKFTYECCILEAWFKIFCRSTKELYLPYIFMKLDFFAAHVRNTGGRLGDIGLDKQSIIVKIRIEPLKGVDWNNEVSLAIDLQ